jgi:hypothetical protein
VIRVLSLGAGVQSTTVLLMTLAGELPPLDAAIFADTGWEPRAVYEHLDRLEELAAAAGVPIYRVSAGNIRADTLAGRPAAGAGQRGGFATLPVYTRSGTGETGMAVRQCTHDYKVRPIRRRLRELMREAGARRATQVFGISIDEVGRMRDPDVRYLSHAYPLVEREITRQGCLRWIERNGFPRPPRSACIGCPFHSDYEWRALRERPEEWADAVEFDRAIRSDHGSIMARLDGEAYLHRQRVPLDEVDLSTPEDRGQLSLWANECEGMCGV